MSVVPCPHQGFVFLNEVLIKNDRGCPRSIIICLSPGTDTCAQLSIISVSHRPVIHNVCGGKRRLKRSNRNVFVCQCTVLVGVCSVALTIFPFDWHVRSTFPVNRWTERLTSSYHLQCMSVLGNISLCIMNRLRVKRENGREISI